MSRQTKPTPISITPELYGRIKEHVRKNGLVSVSHFFREATIEKMEGKHRDVEGDFRELFREVEGMKKVIEEIRRIVNHIWRTLGEGQGTDIDKLAREVENVLYETGESMTVEEVRRYLPAYDGTKILNALQKLESENMVDRESEDEDVKWKPLEVISDE